MYLLPEKKMVLAKPAPAEANPFRRAVFMVPILRAWLPLPLSCGETLGGLTHDTEF
jgi:hypothetical protein